MSSTFRIMLQPDADGDRHIKLAEGLPDIKTAQAHLQEVVLPDLLRKGFKTTRRGPFKEDRAYADGAGYTIGIQPEGY